MLKRYFQLILLTIIILSCDNSNNTVQPIVINESDEFNICNRIVEDCRNGGSVYCLNGFTWGPSNPLNQKGGNVTGPQEAAGLITFSFQEENGLVNTHAQVDLPSKSFSNLPNCTKDQIRKALDEWASVANISFEEMTENSDSDIRFFVADIRQSGVGFPNFPVAPCSTIGGDLIIQSDLWTADCEILYNLFLHEIGHVLGLGHVGTRNIMNADFSEVEGLDGLQAGDIEGLVQLYGVK
ncbi:MAG: matrixin family metalloprotease [Bacteroidota bacterium]